MDFKNFIEAVNIIQLQIDFSKDSTKSLDEVKEIAIDRCNRIAEENDLVDVKCLVIDYKTGNRYMAYSKYMIAKYDVLNYDWILEYDALAVKRNNELLLFLGEYVSKYTPTEDLNTFPAYEEKVAYNKKGDLLGKIINSVKEMNNELS